MVPNGQGRCVSRDVGLLTLVGWILQVLVDPATIVDQSGRIWLPNPRTPVQFTPTNQERSYMITNRQRTTAEKLATILTAQELDILVDAMAALDLPSLEKVHLFKEVDTVVSEAFGIALNAMDV